MALRLLSVHLLDKTKVPTKHRAQKELHTQTRVFAKQTPAAGRNLKTFNPLTASKNLVVLDSVKQQPPADAGSSNTMSETGSSSKDAATSTGGRSSTTSNMTPLPDDFEPGPDDVICGRGKKCYNHIGNERFRRRVLTFLEEYSRAKSKLDKSGVLSKVVYEVRQNSPKGGFVKQDANGVWFEVGDFLAREKTSQAFRDALHDRYKSSNLSKKKRRQEEQAKSHQQSYSRTVRSEYDISSRLERLSNEVIGARKWSMGI